MMDESTEGVQPDEGQGAQASDSPYADYLNRLPEEVRGDVEPVFRDWDANVTKRFQEASEYRKQWEPYESTGVHQQTPEEIQWALQVAEAAKSNPQALREYLDQTFGPVQAQQIEQAAQQDNLTFDQFDPNAQLEQLLSSKLGPIEQQLQQFSQWQTQQQQEAEHNRIQSAIDTEIGKLKEEHADRLPEPVKEQFEDIIERFGMKYATPGADPASVVSKAWADFEALQNQLERATLQAKADAPSAAESGGVADGSPDKIHNMKEAGVKALEILQAQHRGQSVP